MDDSKINLFAKGGIDGQVRENCAISVLYPPNSNKVKWYDWKCSDNLPALCEVPRKEDFILRGKDIKSIICLLVLIFMAFIFF